MKAVRCTVESSFTAAKLIATIAVSGSALCANAADTSSWVGGASGVWGSGYESNWDVYPDSTRYAQFSNPLNETISVQVVGEVETYGVVGSSRRTAGINFTGTGKITNHRSTVFAIDGGPSLTDWDVDVVNLRPSSDTSLYIEGTNVFHRLLDCSTAYNFNTKAKARMTLCDSARLTAQHMKIVAGSSFECTDSSVASLTKDLLVEPGAQLKVADNTVLTLRKLTLPFSPEDGVSDEWTMDGGVIRAMDNSSNCCLDFPYVNATKTLSGSGTFRLYYFNFNNASNLVLRLNGPDMYVYNPHFSGSATKNILLETSGGSTLGAWGADVLMNYWTNRIAGAVTVDTSDYDDRTVARSVTLGKYLNCNGMLTVKGVGTCILGGIEQPNLGLTGKESSTTTVSSAYALGDIVLNDSSKLKVDGYMGHKGESARVIKSLTMDGNSSLDVGRYAILTGDATLSGNASAVIRHSSSGDANPIFTCANLSLADDASLSVTGTISATSLSMSGSAHLAFTAGTTFAAGATFGTGNWTMEIAIPSGYEAGIRPVVMGAEFEGDFAEHVTLVGDATGWSARTLNGNLVLYKDAPASGIEWIGDSQTSDNWSDTANWNEGNVPSTTDVAAFGGLDRLTPSLDSAISVKSLLFRASAGPFVLNGTETLSLTADCSSRGSASPENASIVSHSSFDQTIATPVDFGQHHAYLVSDGGGALKLTGGLTAGNDWHYLVVGGDVQVGGTCSIGVFSFKTSTTGTPSCLRVLPDGQFTIRLQGIRGLVENTSYVGRIVVEEDGEMTVKDGDCVFWYGGLENVIDGTLTVKGDQDNGRLVGGPSEQYYTGKGAIYADSARSGRTADAASHYINFGGTLKLYMNGNWYTATYRSHNTEGVIQDPNYPTRFRMTDGTTLGAANDWTYGPMAGAYDTIAATITPADRKSIMTGTVTVNTQNPTNATAHTITFVDPLDASAANVVKAGAGTLAFNEPEGYRSSISNLSVNAGTVRFGATAPEIRSMSVADGATASFATAPTLSETLTVVSVGSNIRSAELSPAEWRTIATAAEILGPAGATEWKSSSAKNKYRIVTSGNVQVLQGRAYLGMSIVVR